MSDNKDYLKSYFKERRVAVYLHPKYQKYVTAMAFNDCATKSTTCQSLIKKYFDSLPADEINKYQKIFEKMTAEEKSKPKL